MCSSGCHEFFLICHLKNVESILLNILRVEELSITVPVNPETPISDQDRISPYSINILSSRQVMGKEKNVN